MKRCSRCILPEQYPDIVFNAEGVCNYCLTYTPRDLRLGNEKLLQLLESEPRDGKYDCLVPISGGKDSMYLLYYAVNELHLRVLAVNYDAGFQTDVATANVENACRILNVPLIKVTPPGEYRARMLRASLRLSRALGRCYAVCKDCETMLRTAAVNVAREHEVPFVLWGASLMESKNPTVSHRDRSGLPRMLKTLITRFGTPAGLLTILRAMPSHMRLYALAVCQRLRAGVPLRHVLRTDRPAPLPKKNPRFVYVYDYISWDAMKSVETLEAELEWQHPEDRDVRFDCDIHALGNYSSLRRKHISADGELFCRFVREGKLSREEALRRENKIAEVARSECVRLVESLGLNQDDSVPW